MCAHGTEVTLRVPIDPKLAHDGKLRWDRKAIDACIAPIVYGLNRSGVYTSNCCCGHGKGAGSIELHDGRSLTVIGSRVDVPPICHVCGNEAVCFGESEGIPGFACSECCGHGDGDGWCVMIERAA